MVTKETFKREFVKAIRDGNAAVFAGAGLSRASGFVVWKELLRPLAEEIKLNIDEEHDLTAVAQYVRNCAGNRWQINDSILNSYSKDVENKENVKILTRLPIYTYSTTNYDHLLEDGLRENNRNRDVKIDYKQLSSIIHANWRHVSRRINFHFARRRNEAMRWQCHRLTTTQQMEI